MIKLKKINGSSYRKFDQEIELLCYCLMGNHFHVLFYLNGDEKALSLFMQTVMTAYTMYFNKRYNRVGTLFQGVFKASRISSDSYLIHITRYIHSNPRFYKTYEFSSLKYYLGNNSPIWCNPKRILEMFDGSDYLEFVEDYEAQHLMQEELKYELADL